MVNKKLTNVNRTDTSLIQNSGNSLLNQKATGFIFFELFLISAVLGRRNPKYKGVISMVQDQKIVHESEAQRQHVRVELPAKVKIDRAVYNVIDISAGGLSIETDKEIDVTDKVQKVRIFFPFEDFAFHLDILARPIFYNGSKKIAGYRFEDIKATQISLINFIIKSYLAGSLITEGDLLNVVSRENFVNVRHVAQNDNYSGSRWQRVVLMTLIAFFGAAALSFFLGNIYESGSIIKSYQGLVEGNVYTMRANTSGTFHSLLAEDVEAVTKDQPLAVLKREALPAGYAAAALSGAGATEDIVLKSPCDCTLVKKYAQDGEFHILGEPLFKLLPNNAQTWVTASLDPEKVHKLRLQDDAYIKVAGEGRFVPGYVSDFIADDAGTSTRVKIRPKNPLPPEMVGRLAYVEFVVH
jgi:mannuronan synthase